MSRFNYEFLDYTNYREAKESSGAEKSKSRKKAPRKRAEKTPGASAALVITLLVVAAVLAISAMFSALGKETGSHYRLNPSYQNYTSASTSQTACHNIEK